MSASDEAAKLKKKAKASLTLLLVAVISITTATYAWFTLSNSTSVQSMEVRVGTGTKLMVTTKANSTNWDDYTASLKNADVNAALNKNSTYSEGLKDIALWPLTSGNGYTLYTRGGNAVANAPGVDVDSKQYLELDLWFMSSTDNLKVYLNKDPSAAEVDDGTKVVSNSQTNDARQAHVDQAVRLSFTTYQTNNTTVKDSLIYEPNKDGEVTLHGNAAQDAGAIAGGTADQTTYDKLGTNTGAGGPTGFPIIFTIAAKNTPTRVTLRLWLEGEDPECLNGNGEAGTDYEDINLEDARLLAQLRFCGADSNGNYAEGTVS